jgi:ABC-type nitrate/sulfonate/bicarbonate transport system permease component
VPAVVWQLGVLVAFVLLWQAAAAGDRFGGAVPGPGAVAAAAAELARTAAFWSAIGDTGIGWALGLLLSFLVAVPVGVLIGSTRAALLSTRLTIDVLRTIPPVTLIPLAVLLYGPTLEMKLLLIGYGTVWPLMLQVVYAVREVDPVARDMARAYRLPLTVRWRRLLLPSSLPFVFTGLRVGATIALLLSVGAEIIGDAPGLGRALVLAQISSRPAQAYVYVVVAALLGVAVNALLLSVQRRVLFWHGDYRSRT